jgi:hypothetical protein
MRPATIASRCCRRAQAFGKAGAAEWRYTDVVPIRLIPVAALFTISGCGNNTSDTGPSTGGAGGALSNAHVTGGSSATQTGSTTSTVAQTETVLGTACACGTATQWVVCTGTALATSSIVSSDCATGTSTGISAGYVFNCATTDGCYCRPLWNCSPARTAISTSVSTSSATSSATASGTGTL